MPTNVGYGSSYYGGDIHTVPTGRYDTTAPRGTNGHRGVPATITTYNVTHKDNVPRSSSVRNPSATRHRSSTVDSNATKPIIVTTNHSSRPHNSSSHSGSGSGRTNSPTRDAYRSSEDTYFAQPASSIRSRSSHRHTQSATLDSDEFHRLRDRVGGDDRLRAPRGAGTDSYRRHREYAGAAPRDTSENGYEGYEYTKPGELARYDLDNDRPRSRAGRRESFDRNYYRPTVNLISSERAERGDRARGPPPTSVGLDRYNRAAAAGIYDRPTVTMPPIPALPAVPAAPPVDAARRSSLLESPGSPTSDRRSSRPRPVSLYQESTPRMSQPDDIYRSRDDVAMRGFGIRPELLEHADKRRDYDDHRPRKDYDDRELWRRSDEELDKPRGRFDERKAPDLVKERPARTETSRTRTEPPRTEGSLDRKEAKDNTGRGEKVREKVAAGLGVAAAAIGLGKDKDDDKENKGSPKRGGARTSDEDLKIVNSRSAERYKPRGKEYYDQKSSRDEANVVVEQTRKEPKKERVGSRDDSSSRERDRARGKERGREMEKERERRDAESKTTVSKDSTRDSSPISDAVDAGSKRRSRPAAAFNPTDTKGLMDLKAELAAMEEDKPKEKKERASESDTGVTDRATISERDPSWRDESRGREMTIVDPEHKQVRVVSPPRDKTEQKPIKGILKQPTTSFPEEPNPVREGVAPHKDDKTKKDVPAGARWTKISRKLVNPDALAIGKERFELRDDFVIVLRVLSKEEIQAYATATAQLREKRRKQLLERGEVDDYDNRERDREREDEERRRRHRYRDDDERRERDRDRGDRDRDRERRYDYDDDWSRTEYSGDYHHHHSHRDRHRDYDGVSTEDRR